MLDSFIIEELRRREEQERARSERPVLRLPIEEHDEPRQPSNPTDEDADNEGKRGVVVIDI